MVQATIAPKHGQRQRVFLLWKKRRKNVCLFMLGQNQKILWTELPEVVMAFPQSGMQEIMNFVCYLIVCMIFFLCEFGVEFLLSFFYVWYFFLVWLLSAFGFVFDFVSVFTSQ